MLGIISRAIGTTTLTSQFSVVKMNPHSILSSSNFSTATIQHLRKWKGEYSKNLSMAYIFPTATSNLRAGLKRQPGARRAAPSSLSVSVS